MTAWKEKEGWGKLVQIKIKATIFNNCVCIVYDIYYESQKKKPVIME